MTFQEFLDSNQRNEWITEFNISVYCRKGTHLLTQDIFCDCIDIGSVTVEEDERGKGLFTQFLERVESIAYAECKAVWVESILEPRLVEFLKKRGYEKCPFYADEAPTYFKLPEGGVVNKIKQL
jgi:N-acetylglutamate synthase-like GNAT family acetyltransferase